MIDSSVINELDNIVSYRTRYFTLVTVSSDYYYIQLSLLFIDRICIVDDVLLIYLSNGFRYEFGVLDSTNITYVTDEPLSDVDKKKMKRRGRVS